MARGVYDRDTRIEQELVERLKSFRLRALNASRNRAFTHSELALRSNGAFNRDNLYQWENGICLPSSMAQWIAWADVLGLSLNITISPQ